MTTPTIPQPIITEEKAIEKTKRKCAFSDSPTIDEDDIKDALEDNVRATIWAANTLYKVGDIIMPTEDNRMGRMLRCVAGGYSGTTEPNWRGVADRSSWLSSGISIGNVGSTFITVSDHEVSWVDDGLETDLWDMEQVYSDVWMKKAQKALQIPNVTRAGNSYETNTIYRNCVDMSNRYGGKFIK